MTANQVPQTTRTTQNGKSVFKAELGPAHAPEANEPTQDDIRLRAFQIYQARGAGPGQSSEDWEQARRELTARRSSKHN